MSRDLSADKLIQDLETELLLKKNGEWHDQYWVNKGLFNHSGRCIRLLGGYKSIESVSVMISLYKYSNPYFRNRILESLAEIAHNSSVEFLGEVAQKGYSGEPNSYDNHLLSRPVGDYVNTHIRLAGRALCMIEDDAAHKKICELVQNTECPKPYSMLRPMFTYLGKSKRPETNKLLAECLEIEYSFNRYTTLKMILSAISEYSGKEVLLPLCKIIDYKHFSENQGVTLSLENHVLLAMESVVNRLTRAITLEDKEKGLIKMKGKVVY